MSTSTTIPDPTSPNWQRTAWLIVALLAPVALLNYFDRQMLAAMKSSVMHDIPSVGSDANWGLMLGQFKWVYAAMSPIEGDVSACLAPHRVGSTSAGKSRPSADIGHVCVRSDE